MRKRRTSSPASEAGSLLACFAKLVRPTLRQMCNGGAGDQGVAVEKSTNVGRTNVGRTNVKVAVETSDAMLGRL
eukprot:1892994-Prymnesium_polylepis.1